MTQIEWRERMCVYDGGKNKCYYNPWTGQQFVNTPPKKPFFETIVRIQKSYQITFASLKKSRSFSIFPIETGWVGSMNDYRTPKERFSFWSGTVWWVHLLEVSYAMLFLRLPLKYYKYRRKVLGGGGLGLNEAKNSEIIDRKCTSWHNEPGCAIVYFFFTVMKIVLFAQNSLSHFSTHAPVIFSPFSPITFCTAFG